MRAVVYVLVGISLVVAGCGKPTTRISTQATQPTPVSAPAEDSEVSCIVVPIGHNLVNVKYPNMFGKYGCESLDAAQALSKYLDEHPELVVVQLVTDSGFRDTGNVTIAVLKQKGE